MKCTRVLARQLRLIGFLSGAFEGVGSAIGYSNETANPLDRTFDILFPTLLLGTFGLLIGFSAALIYFGRFTWIGALAAIGLPLIVCYTFFLGKFGGLNSSSSLSLLSLFLLGFLIVCYWISDAGNGDINSKS